MTETTFKLKSNNLKFNDFFISTPCYGPYQYVGSGGGGTGGTGPPRPTIKSMFSNK